MPARKDFVAWSPAELARLRHLSENLGIGSAQAARRINDEIHGGQAVRTATMVNLARSRHGILVNRRGGGSAPSTEQPIQTVDVNENGDELTVITNGFEVRTLDELVARAKVDLTVWEVDKPQTRMWEVKVKDAQGKIRNAQNFYIACSFRRKHGPNVKEQVEALIAGAFSKRKALPAIIVRGGNADILQGVVIPDAHIGDLAWGEGTGGPNNDTSIGVDTLRRGVTDVMAQGDDRRVGERHFWLLGDYFQHDGKGMTTKGTPLDYDSRVQKMLKSGSEVLFDLIAASAAKVPTRVVLVPGNHDAVLTWALQRILVSEFRRHKGVTIDDTSTTTKYLTHGKCLIGLDHGDKGKTRLPAVMAAQCAVEWGQTTCRHIHTGHLHGKAKIVTEGGVVVWTHDSLKPADQWHTDEKFNTSPRTIEAYRYHRGGMFAGSDAWSPDLNAAPRRGTLRVA